jgi:cytochrome c5
MKLKAVIAAAALLVAGSAMADGAKVYEATCKACHDAGVAGAPKLGDKAAWEPRIKAGKDNMYKIALNGKPGTGMMPKGGNASLSDADVKSAVDFMVSKAK